MFGIQSFVAVINPPQAAILAVGAMAPTPVVRDGEVVVRNIMRLTLSCDHRILYGADAAEFLGAHPRAAREPAAARAVGQRGSRPVTGASVSSTAPATSSTVSTTSFDRRLNGLGRGLDDGRDGLAGLPDDALHRAGRLARRRRRRRRSGTAARALPRGARLVVGLRRIARGR